MFPRTLVKQNGVICLPANNTQITTAGRRKVDNCRKANGYCSTLKTNLSTKGLWHCGGSWRSTVVLHSTKTDHAETEKHCKDDFNYPSFQMKDGHANGRKNVSSNQGLAEACRYVHIDAEFVNRRARNDLVLLSREYQKLNARAQQDAALLGSGLLKLDARAREDTERIDLDVKKKAESLQHVAAILKSKAQISIKSAADMHWSDGALEADLKRADLAARRRAIADSLMALEFVKNIHEMMLCKSEKSSPNDPGHITIEKNGKTVKIIPRDASIDNINAIQEAYWSMASALSEADGIDYTDPEELELLVAALIDFDAMDGKSSVSLLAECSSSPDVSTRRALANALSAAPSMWTLGNAGMGALQRLVEDSNPAIAAAALKTIKELEKQWAIEEGDSWRFIMGATHRIDNRIEDDD